MRHWDKDYIIRKLGDVHFALDFAMSPLTGEGYWHDTIIPAEIVRLLEDRDVLLRSLKEYRKRGITPMKAWPRR